MAVNTAPRRRAVAVAPSAAVARVRSSAIRDLLAVADRPDVTSLAGGLPLAAAFPVDEVAAAAADVLATDGARVLQYSATAGDPGLRRWVADRHGAAVDEVVITSGSQQALDLLVRSVVEPGAAVALADPAYVGALQVLRMAGADLLAVPSDAGGLCVDLLADRLRAGVRPALVYVVASFDNPTGTTLSAERRVELAALADRYGFLVVDDDPYGDLRWAGSAPPPLASLGDRVVTLGTTSKVLCPGLRVGWAVSPPALAAHVERGKQAADLQTGTLVQAVVHRLVTTPGLLDERLPRLRSTYAAHATALAEALRRELGDVLSFADPDGGMFLWADAPGLDVDALLPVAVAHGVAYVPGAAFAVDGRPRHALRLSFATATPAELDEAAGRLARAVAAAGDQASATELQPG